MKSAYELALERSGGTLNSIPSEIKEKIAEIEQIRKAKVAEAELSAQQRIGRENDPEKISEIKDALVTEIASINDKYERETAAADKLFSLLPEDQGKEFRSLWEEFDAMETPEAQYAASIDRFQPFLHNYRTQGYTWKEGNVHYTQVYERMEILRTAMPALWPTVLNMMQDSVEKGYLLP